MLEGLSGKFSSKQLKYLVIVKRNIDRLSSLMDDLLDLSRLKSGNEELRLGRVNIMRLFKELKEDFHVHAELSGITIRISLPRKELTVVCDRRKIKRIMGNLIHNAIKYTPKGGGITLKAIPSGREMLFSVTDTGCGIPKEYHTKIFDKFYKIERAGSQEIKGAGLGLCIAKGLVEAQGGHIWVESPPKTGGKGSAFSFTISCKKRRVS